MTTIKQFLNTTSKAKIKKADWIDDGAKLVTDTRQAIADASQATVDAVNDGVQQLGNAASPYVDEVRRSLPSDVQTGINFLFPSDSGMQDEFDKFITPDLVRQKLTEFSQKKENAPYAPLFNRVLNNDDLMDRLVNQARQIVFEQGKPEDGWKPGALARVAADPRIQNAIITGLTDTAAQYLINTPDDLIAITLDSMEEKYPDQVPAIREMLKRNPAMAGALFQKINPAVAAAYKKNKLQAFSGEALPELIAQVQNPTIGVVQDYGLREQNFIPDNEVPRGWQGHQYAEHLALNGGSVEGVDPNATPYNNIFASAYRKGDESLDDSGMLISSLNYMLDDPDIGVQMIDTYRRTPVEQRDNAFLTRLLRGYVNYFKSVGDYEHADQAEEFLNGLSDTLGEYGKGIVDSKTIYEYARGKKLEKFREAMDAACANSSYYRKFRYDIARDKGRTDQEKERYRQYFAQQNQGRQNNILDDSFFGWFKDPKIQRAVRYAAPWLTYGSLLASLGTMFGTNSLWPLVLFGGLGSGLYGYGAKDWFGASDDTLQSIDDFVGSINRPLSLLGGMLPKSMQGIRTPINAILGVKPRPEEATNESAPVAPGTAPTGSPTSMYQPKNGPFNHNSPFKLDSEQDYSPFNNQLYADYNDYQFSPTGTVRNRNQTNRENQPGYYINPRNNPGMIGSQQLSYA